MSSSGGDRARQFKSSQLFATFQKIVFNGQEDQTIKKKKIIIIYKINLHTNKFPFTTLKYVSIPTADRGSSSRRQRYKFGYKLDGLSNSTYQSYLDSPMLFHLSTLSKGIYVQLLWAAYLNTCYLSIENTRFIIQ